MRGRTDPTRPTPPTSSWATATTSSTAPVKRGEPANDALLTKAIENYKKSADVETDPKIKRLALDYLVARTGPTS